MHVINQLTVLWARPISFFFSFTKLSPYMPCLFSHPSQRWRKRAQACDCHFTDSQRRLYLSIVCLPIPSIHHKRGREPRGDNSFRHLHFYFPLRAPGDRRGSGGGGGGRSRVLDVRSGERDLVLDDDVPDGICVVECMYVPCRVCEARSVGWRTRPVGENDTHRHTGT